MHWVVYALMTVVSWGLYGAFLNKGAKGFDHDRMKAFFFVGIAYVLIAVLAPLAVIIKRRHGVEFFEHPAGVKWSLFAGIVGALGAFTVLFALSENPVSKLNPAMGASQVMSLVFAGAPIVAAVYGLMLNPPKEGLGSLDWRFVAGLVLAAGGGALVTLYKPT